MTKRFAQNQLKDLKAHLQLIQKEYDSLKEELGEEWMKQRYMRY